MSWEMGVKWWTNVYCSWLLVGPRIHCAEAGMYIADTSIPMYFELFVILWIHLGCWSLWFFLWGPKKIVIFPRKKIRDFFLLELTDFSNFLGKKLPSWGNEEYILILLLLEIHWPKLKTQGDFSLFRIMLKCINRISDFLTQKWNK